MSCPKITFGTSRLMNEFCHISVLYADQLPDELALGMLGNKSYQEQNAHLREDKVLQGFRQAEQISPSSWYSLARALMRAGKLGEVRPNWKAGGQATFLLGILFDGVAGYNEIWEKTQSRLQEYKEKFAAVWDRMSDSVLSNLSVLSKREWAIDEVLVHFVDCLWGGFAWVDSIAFAAFPDIEVQKKFLAHELSELITPRAIVEPRLTEAGLDSEIAHTVVDMIAYFSVKDYIAKPVFPNPERKGIRPNPNYYPAVEVLYPLFEQYSQDTSAYKNFGALVKDMILKVKGSQVQLEAHG